MPWPIFAFVLSQVTLGHDLDIEEVAKCASVFPKRYVCPQWTAPWTNWCCVGDTMLHAQFHTRYLSSEENAITRSDTNPICSGLLFERDWGQAVKLDPSFEFPIIETRSSISIIASLWKRHYTMVTLTDNASFDPDCIAVQKHWNAIGLQMCESFTGFAIWQAAIGGLITEWGSQWTSVLGRIAGTGNLQVR